jgi:hypothetical protein
MTGLTYTGQHPRRHVVLSVPDATVLNIRELMQMVFYCHMIYSPETSKQRKDTWMWLHEALLLYTYRTAVIHSITYSVNNGSLLSHRTRLLQWSSGCSMRVLPPPLLLINCWSCSPLKGPGPPLGWPHSLRVHAPSHSLVSYTYKFQPNAYNKYVHMTERNLSACLCLSVSLANFYIFL